MPWTREPTGLRWSPMAHPKTSLIHRLIDELKATNINRPQAICQELRNCLEHGFFPDAVNKKFSKWCDFNRRQAEGLAREIGNQLFGSYPQPRFLDQQNKLVENGDRLYEQWCQSVVGGGEGAKQVPMRTVLAALDQFEKDVATALRALRQGISNLG